MTFKKERGRKRKIESERDKERERERLNETLSEYVNEIDKYSFQFLNCPYLRTQAGKNPLHRRAEMKKKENADHSF